MAYLNTSVADRTALLDALATFLGSNGWTAGGSGLNRTFTNANGKIFYTQTYSANQNDFHSGAFTDIGLQISYDLVNVGGLSGSKSTLRPINDMLTGLPNVWFFATSSYCHVALQVANSRYGHFSFGELDPKDQHTASICYASGVYWQFWSNQANFNTSDNPFNYPPHGNHQVDWMDSRSAIGIPDDVFDDTLFFPNGAVQNASHVRLSDREFQRSTGGDNSGKWLDYLCNIDNQGYTGGVIISPMPVVAYGSSNDVRAFVGQFPDCGLVNMAGLSPGQTITYADDDWIVFPVKQLTAVDAAAGGANPVDQTSSAQFGFAYKKIS